MNYPIPVNPQEIVALRHQPVNEELIAAAIAGVVMVARSKGQSLEELMAEVMADDSLLDRRQRSWLGEIVAQAWASLPQRAPEAALAGVGPAPMATPFL